MSTSQTTWFVPPYRTYPLSKLPQISLLSATPMPRKTVEKPPSSFVPIDTATALATVRADNVTLSIGNQSKNRLLGKKFWYSYF